MRGPRSRALPQDAAIPAPAARPCSSRPRNRGGGICRTGDVLGAPSCWGRRSWSKPVVASWSMALAREGLVLSSECEVPHDAQFETVKAMIGA